MDINVVPTYILLKIIHLNFFLQVTWYHNSFIVDPSDRKTIETRGTKHTLIIRNLKDSDFGNYSCVAENNLGKDKKFMELAGKQNGNEFRGS